MFSMPNFNNWWTVSLWAREGYLILARIVFFLASRGVTGTALNGYTFVVGVGTEWWLFFR